MEPYGNSECVIEFPGSGFAPEDPRESASPAERWGALGDAGSDGAVGACGVSGSAVCPACSIGVAGLGRAAGRGWSSAGRVGVSAWGRSFAGRVGAVR